MKAARWVGGAVFAVVLCVVLALMRTALTSFEELPARPQVIDLVNHLLASKNSVVVRGKDGIRLFAADRPIALEFVRRVTPAELNACGNTEIVSVLYLLRAISADDIAPEVQ